MKLQVAAIILLVSGVLVSWKSPTHLSSQDNKLEEIVNGKQFKIECEWAMPMVTGAMSRMGGILPAGSNVSRINLIGNPNFLKVEGDSVSADLPYYGERQMGGAYGSTDTGVEFDGVPKKYTVKKNKKKGHYDIRFSISHNSEAYDVTVRLFPNLNAHISVNSNQRNIIRYDGQIVPFEEEE